MFSHTYTQWEDTNSINKHFWHPSSLPRTFYRTGTNMIHLITWFLCISVFPFLQSYHLVRWTVSVHDELGGVTVIIAKSRTLVHWLWDTEYYHIDICIRWDDDYYWHSKYHKKIMWFVSSSTSFVVNVRRVWRYRTSYNITRPPWFSTYCRFIILVEEIRIENI